MKQYAKQNRQPKPQPANQVIERTKRDLQALGFEVHIDYGSGVYAPSVTLSVWPKREVKENQA